MQNQISARNQDENFRQVMGEQDGKDQKIAGGNQLRENRRVSISADMLQNLADVNGEGVRGVRQSILPDIDGLDLSNPHAVGTYVKDIYSAYREQEKSFAPKKHYMQQQVHLRPKYRTILVDWMVRLCYQYEMLKETYYLAVNILDRYLSRSMVEKENLQLAGITAFLIASKYEEIQHPTVEKLVEACGGLYSTEQIKQTERRILRRLDYFMTGATQFHFLNRYLKAAGLDDVRDNNKRKQIALIQYLVELTSLDYDFLQFNYSEIVVASIYVGQRAFKVVDALPYALQKHSGYTLAKILPCAKKIYALWKTVPENKSIVMVPHIYKKDEFLKVSLAQVPLLNLD